MQNIKYFTILNVLTRNNFTPFNWTTDGYNQTNFKHIWVICFIATNDIETIIIAKIMV